jgi:uncharacterized coiled-coil protein SlyX
MASDPQMELRVSRLENDTSSIYDLISEIRSTQQEHSQRFDKMDQRFDKMDQRFDKIETTLTEVIRRLPDPS